MSTSSGTTRRRVEGHTIRKRSESFQDFYGQATLFYNSMSGWEREHIVAAYRFELGKCDHMHVRARQVEQLNHIDHGLAVVVAEGIGVAPPTESGTPNHGRSSPALSQANTTFESVRSLKVAILIADGVDAGATALAQTLTEWGATPELLAPAGGTVRSEDGTDIPVDRVINTMASVRYDAVLIPSGQASAATLSKDGYAVHFVAEAIKHAKPVGGLGAGRQLIERTANGAARLAEDDGAVHNDHGVMSVAATNGTVPAGFLEAFRTALARHRAWERSTAAIPA